jgi:hypothetical protein
MPLSISLAGPDPHTEEDNLPRIRAQETFEIVAGQVAVGRFHQANPTHAADQIREPGTHFGIRRYNCGAQHTCSSFNSRAFDGGGQFRTSTRNDREIL